MHVFVLDKDKKPLDPCHPARARKLLDKGRAAVFRRFPFTIILKDRTVEESAVHEHRIKIDPGSKTTGVAVVQEENGQVVFAAEIEHRGEKIKASMESRKALRRNRRSRKTRYRKQRFNNRPRPKGWLPPSLESRLANTQTWVERIRQLCPVVAISMELVRFDMQAIENPEINGVEYNEGEETGGMTMAEWIYRRENKHDGCIIERSTTGEDWNHLIAQDVPIGHGPRIALAPRMEEMLRKLAMMDTLKASDEDKAILYDACWEEARAIVRELDGAGADDGGEP
jgi:hypothetical protein